MKPVRMRIGVPSIGTPRIRSSARPSDVSILTETTSPDSPGITDAVRREICSRDMLLFVSVFEFTANVVSPFTLQHCREMTVANPLNDSFDGARVVVEEGVDVVVVVVKSTNQLLEVAYTARSLEGVHFLLLDELVDHLIQITVVLSF